MKTQLQKIQLYCFVILFLGNNLFAQELPTATSELFSGSGICANCHIAGDGTFTTQSGTDISPTTLWRSTMMANAARDPLWQAKVTTEVAKYPALQTIIEDKCTTCHMPLGKTEAIYNGADHFSFDQGLTDPLSLDGVSCTLCHQVQKNNFGTDESFSGGYQVTNVHDIFGPYISPTAMPMFNQSGYTPVYSDHVNHSELCATCHTLFTPYVDNQGQIAGYFPEQTPYLEWENSIYPSESTECQTCHMPAVDEAMKISISPPSLSALRSPIWEHNYVGGNVFMNTMLKIHGAEIGVTASDAHFDSTISKTNKLLKEQTINLSTEAYIIADTLNLDILVENLSGHKFPTGFPSRRAWLHVIVKNGDNEIIFESGNWDSNGEISGLDEGFEPHYKVISEPAHVQIYQAMMKDVDGKVTYTLLRAAQYIKDNRLPPIGFTRMASGYDSVAIIGAAATDMNFNYDENGLEGSGSDLVKYKIPVTGEGTEFTVTVDMCYQTISPRFIDDLYSYSTEQVEKFKNYYTSMDKSPILISSISLNTSYTGIVEENSSNIENFILLGNYPNPFNPDTKIYFHIPKSSHIVLILFDIRGVAVKTILDTYKSAGAHEITFKADNLSSGVYFYQLQYRDKAETRKMILLH